MRVGRLGGGCAAVTVGQAVLERHHHGPAIWNPRDYGQDWDAQGECDYRGEASFASEGGLRIRRDFSGYVGFYGGISGGKWPTRLLDSRQSGGVCRGSTAETSEAENGVELRTDFDLG